MKDRFQLIAIGGLIFLTLLSSCATRKNKREVYFPIDSLLHAQVHYLANAKATVTKVVLLGDKEAKTIYTPVDTSGWIKELNIFQNMDIINKPVNYGAYTVKDGLKDSKSNLKIREFKSKADDLPVEYIKLYYHVDLQNVRKIESKHTEVNAMYAGTRYLILEFENINNRSLLTYYSVHGGQKMFLGDSVEYTINASVSLPD